MERENSPICQSQKSRNIAEGLCEKSSIKSLN